MKTAGALRRRPNRKGRLPGEVLRPARRTTIRAALVVTIAAVHRLTTDRGERNLGRNSAAVAGDAHHLAGATFRPTVAVAGRLAFVTAVLAALRLVRESALCVEGLFIAAEDEFLSAVRAVE